MSQKKIYIAVGIFVTIIVIVVAVVLAVVLPNNNNSSSSDDGVTIQQRTLDNVLTEIGSNDVTASLVEGLPDDPAFYQQLWEEYTDGITIGSGGTPQQQAMAWLLYGDETRNQGQQATVRWALASMY